MGYVRTAGMSTAARRARRRAALVITSLLIGLLLIFALAVASMQGWISLPGGGGADDKATTAAPVPPPSVEAGDVTVNVYNSTSTAGLAGRAGDALRSRGFAVDVVSNDSSDVPGVALIRHGSKGLAEAKLLQASLPKGVKLEADDREDKTVDLVLGEKWKDLPTAEDAAKTGEG